MKTKMHVPDDRGRPSETAPRPETVRGAHVEGPLASAEYQAELSIKGRFDNLEASLREKDRIISALERVQSELMKKVAFATQHGLTIEMDRIRLLQENGRLQKENDNLKQFAYLDPFTGLEKVAVFNNKGFPMAFDTAMRHDLNLVLVLIDLNNLKVTNDMQSYEAGNKLLSKTAEVIKETIRVNDACYKLEAGYRWGGDEFVILANILRGEPGEVHANAKTLVRRLEEAMTAAGVDCAVGACIMAPKESFPVQEGKGTRITYIEKPLVKPGINLSGEDIGMMRDIMFKSAEREMKLDKACKKGTSISSLKRE